MSAVRRLNVYNLGRVDYGSTLALQETLLDLRQRREIDDVLLLLEHEPVITLGRSARDEHMLHSRAALEARGVKVFDIGRGGDVTYHGPGQLVGYPIINLNPDRCDVRKYVAGLEEIMIQVVKAHGLPAERIQGLNGTWSDNRKIGAVGVRIKRWVTMHGFALNVNTDLDAFDVIVPCGIRDKEVTSLAKELQREVSMADVMGMAADKAAAVFDSSVTWHEGPPPISSRSVDRPQT